MRQKGLLFSLPEYDRAFAAFVRKATDDMMSEKQPLPGCPTLRILKGGIPRSPPARDFTPSTSQQKNSRSLHCAVAGAPAPVGMTEYFQTYLSGRTVC
jgi:hypothetical protein